MSAGGGRLRREVGAPVHFVVPAAGAGIRFGGTTPKQFREIAGRPLLQWTVRRLLEAGADSIVLALPESALEAAQTLLPSDVRVRCVAGGASRQASVAMAMAASPCAGDELLAVHDGARPAVAVEDLVAVCRAAAAPGSDGAILGRAVSDTLKRIEGGLVAETVDRTGLFRAETPQVFRRAVLENAYRFAMASGFFGTDEASIVERVPGSRISAVEALHANPKVTTPADFHAVASLLEELAATDGTH